MGGGGGGIEVVRRSRRSSSRETRSDGRDRRGAKVPIRPATPPPPSSSPPQPSDLPIPSAPFDTTASPPYPLPLPFLRFRARAVTPPPPRSLRSPAAHHGSHQAPAEVPSVVSTSLSGQLSRPTRAAPSQPLTSQLLYPSPFQLARGDDGPHQPLPPDRRRRKGIRRKAGRRKGRAGFRRGDV